MCGGVCKGQRVLQAFGDEAKALNAAKVAACEQLLKVQAELRKVEVDENSDPAEALRTHCKSKAFSRLRAAYLVWKNEKPQVLSEDELAQFQGWVTQNLGASKGRVEKSMEQMQARARRLSCEALRQAATELEVWSEGAQGRSWKQDLPEACTWDVIMQTSAALRSSDTASTIKKLYEKFKEARAQLMSDPLFPMKPGCLPLTFLVRLIPSPPCASQIACRSWKVSLPTESADKHGLKRPSKFFKSRLVSLHVAGADILQEPCRAVGPRLAG